MKTSFVRFSLTTAGALCMLAGLSTTARAAVAVPEIDAGSLTGGLALMAGVTLMITGRLRKPVEPPQSDGL